MNFKEAQMQKNTETPLNARVDPPSEPACFQNPVFKQCIEDIFSIFVSYSVNMSIFVSGGSLSRTYLDTCMSEGHKSSFGDIDFKVPNCSQDELWWFASNYNKFTDEQLFCPSPLAAAFNALLYCGGILEKVYYKGNDASARLVINIKWRGVAVDFVLFSETLLEHAMKVDLSVSAGFYNPVWSEIFFPCDRFLENNQYGLRVPCDRSAKDFLNKELNLVFPERFWDVFDEDPIRILRIVQAVSRSDYTLSTVLRESITNYLYSRRETVFSKVNPDRLYYNLKSLFFSGHSVKNLSTLMELNLLEELFLNLSYLSPDSKDLVFYLIKCVAIKSDENYLLSPSLLFYAVYWETIKDKSYDQNVIFELSNGKIRLPVSNNGLHEKETFNETVHKNNLEYLQKCEREYKGHQKHESFSDDKIGPDVLFFGDRDNPISVVVSSSPIPAGDDLPPELESVETKKSASVVVSLSATEPRPLGSGNPGAFGPGSESTNETMIKPKKSSNKKLKKESKADNPLILDEYSIYKERCQQAIALLDSKKYKEAEKVFNVAIRLNSTWPDAYCGLGQLFKKKAEHYDSSIKSVLNQLNLLKKNAKQNKATIGKYTKDHKGYLQQQDEKYSEAIGYYEKTLGRSPQYHQAIVALKEIGEFYASTLAKENTLEIDTIIPFTSKPVALEPSKKKEKSLSKQKVNPILSLCVNGDKKDIHEQQQKCHQDLLRKAQQEENAGNDLKAIECYKHLFTQSHSLAGGYKCIQLYKKLGEYHKAKEYADKLVSISEEEYARVYKNPTTIQEKPFDDYQYHNCYALYQRGKLFLKLKQIMPASQDLVIVITLSQDHENKLDSALLELAIRACIKLGRYNCFMAYETTSAKIRDLYIHGLREYCQLAEKAMKTMDCDHYLWSDVYLGLGDAQRLLGNFNNTKHFYEKALMVIEINIDNLYYPFDSIWGKFYKYASHVGEFLVNKLSTAVLSQQIFILSEQDHYLLQLLNEVCCSSVVYSNSAFYGSPSAVFQGSHIIKIKIALIYKRYDDAISQINCLLQGDIKKTNCCKRDLLLFLGVCYEQKLDYEQALSYYHKAQQLERYNDDNSHYNELVLLAETAGKRMALRIKQSKKQVPIMLFPLTYLAVLPPKQSLVETNLIEIVTLEEKAEALRNLSVAQKAREEGNITLAEQAYRVYLSYACRVAQENSQTNTQTNIYGLFNQFANKIIHIILI